MPTLHRILRVAVAGLTLAAVVAQLYDSIHRGRSVVNFFSFFTIQSNLLAVVMLVAAAFTARLASLRGAVTLYLATTGIVYALLLAGREEALQTSLPWVNAALHYVTPVAVVADWVVAPAYLSGSYPRIVGTWLIYPLVYCAGSMVRGAITGWFPYPFLHPANGLAGVVTTILAIALSDALLGALIVWYSRLRSAGHV